MKNNKETIWVAVIIAVIGFVALYFSGCGGSDDNNNNESTFTSMEAFNNWLSTQPNNTSDNPYRVKLNVNNLSGHYLKEWSNANKYVYLDLSNSTVTSIGDSTFASCSTLVGITIGNSVTSIGSHAFEYSGLTSITIPDSVTNIGDKAFDQCNKLTSVTIGNSVTSIGSHAFGMCNSLTSVTIPNSVTNIGESAFIWCNNLTSVTIGNSVTNMGNSAFACCSSLTSLTILYGVTNLCGFNECTNLTNVNIPDSVTSIGDNAFYKTGLTSVTIPDSVTSIGNNAFEYSGLTSVTIGNSVTSIGEHAFYPCDNLTSVTFLGTIPSSGYSNAYNVFPPGDLRAKFYATDTTNGTPGTYTRPDSNSETWTRQN